MCSCLRSYLIMRSHYAKPSSEVTHEARNDDETTATQLQHLLASRNVYVSLSTILRNWRQLGWVYRGSAYYKM